MIINTNSPFQILSFDLMNQVKTLDSNLKTELEEISKTNITSSKDLKALLPKIERLQNNVSSLRWESNSTLTKADLAALETFDDQLYSEEKEIRNQIRNYRILKNTLRESIFELYRECQLPHNTRIAAATYSLPDGFGDYANTIGTATDLLGIFPNTSVKVFAVIDPNRFDPLEEIEKGKKYPFAVQRWKGEPNAIDSQLSPRDKLAISSNDLFLSISSDFKTGLEPYLSPSTKKAASRLLEYGINDPNYMGFTLDLSHNTVLTGNGNNLLLRFSNYLSHLRSLPEQERRTKALQALSQPTSTLIFGSSTNLPDYFEKTDLSYAYFRAMTSSHTLQAFISVIVGSQQESTKDLDIVCRFNPDSFLNDLDLDYLRQNGIGAIIFITSEENSQKMILQAEGKVLRLINPFPIPNQDALSLTALSSTLIGCTGDSSLSEALSTGPFFYDSFCTKGNLIKGLTQHASNHGFPLVADYISQVREMITKFEDLPLKDPQQNLLVQQVVNTVKQSTFFQQFSQWQYHLHANNNYKNALELLVKRAWMMKKNEPLFTLEKEFIKKLAESHFFTKRSLTSEEIQNEFKSILSKNKIEF